MGRAGRAAVLRLGALVVAVAAVSSCASSGGAPSAGNDVSAAADASMKTQQEVQSELMSFADRFFAASLEMARTLEQIVQTPEGRYNAAGARLLALTVTTDIAASPNPGAALLDMCVYITLKRAVWEDYWMPEVYGEGTGRVVLDSYDELEQDIWGIAAGVYTPEQLADLRGLIDDWRSHHPDAVSVDFVRLSELGDARRVQTLVDAGRPGGMLAPIREANRSLEEMRMLAERLAFLMTRMQLMLSLQVEMASAKLATMPEVRQLLEDSGTFAGVSDRAADTFATLVADLPEERRAAIDQILSGLSSERERMFADLGAEDGKLRPALQDVRQTLESGRELSALLDQTIRDFDVLTERMMKGNPKSPRPFDIMDWKATLAEGTDTARELHATLASLEHILGSSALEGQLNPIVEGAHRLQDEVVDETIDRAFVLGVALIFIFFALLTLHRWLIRRLAPARSGKPESGP